MAGDALAAARKAEAFLGRRLDIDGLRAEQGAQALLHGGNMRPELRPLAQDRNIGVADGKARRMHAAHDLLQQQKARNALVLRVVILAVEVCSFSKIAGFTGTRCGYTVVPQAIVSDGQSLNKMWLRRQTTKFNGVAYVVQRGAEAVFTEEGMKEIQHNLDYYRQNAAVIAAALDEAGVWYCGGKNSPYIWLRCPNNMGSWEFFDWLLETANVVGTPGEGFGECGKGYFRLTAFGDAAKTKEAAARIVAALKTL